MSAQDLSTNIGAAATGPAEVSGDAGSMRQQPLGDLIKADQYLAGKAARARKRRGVMYTKVIPAAAFPDSQGTGVTSAPFNQGF